MSSSTGRLVGSPTDRSGRTRALHKYPSGQGKNPHPRRGVVKTESTLATQVRTEKIGLAAFFHRQRIPMVASPAYPCGWQRQIAKHVSVCCPLYDMGDSGSAGAPTNFEKFNSTAQSFKNFASRFIKTGFLVQFSVAAKHCTDKNWHHRMLAAIERTNRHLRPSLL